MPELNETDIRNLYLKVLEKDNIKHHHKFRKKIYAAVVEMGEAYKPIMNNFAASYCQKPNYNDKIFRFAYILKYATLHTSLVQEIMQSYFEYRCSNVLYDIIDRYGELKLCCLGGGPGVDLIGLASFLLERGLFNCSAVLVDEKEWRKTTESVLCELRCGEYGRMSEFVKSCLKTSYLSANLVEEFDQEVFEAINSANFITMVKFISAVNCNRCQEMLEKIFVSMKRGSFLMFIDNAAGGFYEMMANTANNYDMTPLQHPLKHAHFKKEHLNLSTTGFTSCIETTVTVQIWRKTSNRTFSDFLPRAECGRESLVSQRLTDSPISPSYRQSGFPVVPRSQKTVTLPDISTVASNRNESEQHYLGDVIESVLFLPLLIFNFTVFVIIKIVEFFRYHDEWESQ